MSAEVTKDENGIDVKSMAKKVVEPRPAPEDLTRIRVGPGDAEYEYCDPCTVFQLERLVQSLTEDPPKTKGERNRRGMSVPLYVRGLAERATPFWPDGGYVTRRVDHLGMRFGPRGGPVQEQGTPMQENVMQGSGTGSDGAVPVFQEGFEDLDELMDDPW